MTDEAQNPEQHLVKTYFGLRTAIAILAFAFPLVLCGVGYLRGIDPVAGSLSAYYHAIPGAITGCTHPDAPRPFGGGLMRDYFVAMLFMIAGFLIPYRGYSNKENWTLNVAAVFASGVALCPMPWNCGPTQISAHYVCAMAFFACLAYVCIFCRNDTLRRIDNPAVKAWYRNAYSILAVVMLASPAGAVVANYFAGGGVLTLLLEWFGIYSFAAFWVVKSCEIDCIVTHKKGLPG